MRSRSAPDEAALKRLSDVYVAGRCSRGRHGGAARLRRSLRASRPGEVSTVLRLQRAEEPRARRELSAPWAVPADRKVVPGDANPFTSGRPIYSVTGLHRRSCDAKQPIRRWLWHLSLHPNVRRLNVPRPSCNAGRRTSANLADPAPRSSRAAWLRSALWESSCCAWPARAAGGIKRWQ